VPIPTIFEIEGEAGFRRRESQTIAERSELRGIVMATGGGAVLAKKTATACNRLAGWFTSVSLRYCCINAPAMIATGHCYRWMTLWPVWKVCMLCAIRCTVPPPTSSWKEACCWRRHHPSHTQGVQSGMCTHQFVTQEVALGERSYPIHIGRVCCSAAICCCRTSQ